MSLDPYALCPCESGKKLKFCCADIASDMIKALQLHEGGQSKAALKILEKLHADQPARAWVATSLAGVQLFLENPEAARDSLSALLEEEPDHPLACILVATAALDLDGYDKARSVIHRAFTKGAKHHPEMIGSLAAGISSELFHQGKFPAARQHLEFAMRLVRDEDRQQLFMRMLDFYGERTVHYPFRGVINPRPLTLGPDDEKVFRTAVRLSALGCWHEAALMARRLLENHETMGELWYNIGLFHSWDGDQEQAAEALHKAAELITDQELAIEAETLAQLFDLDATAVTETHLVYHVGSMSKLLSQLDELPRFQRVAKDPQDEAPVEVTSYRILDQELDESKVDTSNIETLPFVVGLVSCIDDNPDDEHGAICLIDIEEAEGPEIEKLMTDLLGVDALCTHDEHHVDTADDVWADYRGLYRQRFVPVGGPANLAAEVGRATWDDVIDNKWPDLPLAALDGKTPQEASDVTGMAVRLAAAINVFDAFVDRYSYQLDVAALREKFSLPAIEAYRVVDTNEVSSCDVLQMLRININTLNDEQALILLNRAQLLQHSRFLEAVIDRLIQRDNVIPQERMSQLWHGFVDLARDKYDRQAALDRIQQAREWAERTASKFEEALQWEMRELQFLVTDPKDERIPEFLNQLYQKFLRKLPELEGIVASFLKERGIDPPWDTSGGIVVASSMKSAVEGSSGAFEAQPPESAGKLWIPGQD